MARTDGTIDYEISVHYKPSFRWRMSAAVVFRAITGRTPGWLVRWVCRATEIKVGPKP